LARLEGRAKPWQVFSPNLYGGGSLRQLEQEAGGTRVGCRINRRSG